MSNDVVIFNIQYENGTDPDTHQLRAYRDTGPGYQELWRRDCGTSGGRLAFGPDETVFIMPSDFNGHSITALTSPENLGMGWTDNSRPNRASNDGPTSDGETIDTTSATLGWSGTDPEDDPLTYDIIVRQGNIEYYAASGIGALPKLIPFHLIPLIAAVSPMVRL